MQFRLVLDRDQIDRCRKMAREIATHLERYSSRHTSLAVEDATLRAFGVHGDHKGRPLTEVVLAAIGRERLREGAAYWLGAVMVAKNCTPQLAAKHIAKEGLPERKGEKLPHGEIRRMTRAALAPFLKTIDEAKANRQPVWTSQRWGMEWQLVVTVRTGNVDDDIKHVHELLTRADVGGIEIQSPLSPTTMQLVGPGRGWRAKYDALAAIGRLDQLVRERVRHHKPGVRLTWNGGSLAGPLHAVAVAQSHLTAMAYDGFSLVGIHGIHLKRAIVDQAFVYRLLAKAGVGVTVASERWRGVLDGYTHGHELLMGQLIIEAMGEQAGLPLENISPSHGLVMSDTAEQGRDAVLHEIAHAQLVRELFPQVPLGFALSTQSPEATLLSTSLAALCGFPLGMVGWDATKKADAQQRNAALQLIERARQLLGEIGLELTFLGNGKIGRRANMLVERLAKALQQLHRRDLLQATERVEHRGLFVSANGAVGMDGVVQRHKYYWNPLQEWLTP